MLMFSHLYWKEHEENEYTFPLQENRAYQVDGILSLPQNVILHFQLQALYYIKIYNDNLHLSWNVFCRQGSLKISH